MHKVKILHVQFETHDTKRLITTKPEGYEFEPGQATEIAINQEGWTEEKRPFTFTNLPEDSVLEFTIKEYPDHKGVTQQIHQLQPEDELFIGDAWGALTYQGKGLFLAGGAGITPFLSVLRNLANRKELEGNKLIFANKTHADIINEKELQHYLGSDMLNLLSQEDKAGYEHGLIDSSHIDQMWEQGMHVYVCGPPGFEGAVNTILQDKGIDSQNISFED